jgi:hypothetical protein
MAAKGAIRTRTIVKGFVRLWPREIFYIRGEGKKFGPSDLLKDVLGKPGVYVLYHESNPYYVGKADNSFSDFRSTPIGLGRVSISISGTTSLHSL